MNHHASWCPYAHKMLPPSVCPHCGSRWLRVRRWLTWPYRAGHRHGRAFVAWLADTIVRGGDAENWT